VSTDLLATCLSATVTAGLCALGPAVIRRLPEPVDGQAEPADGLLEPVDGLPEPTQPMTTKLPYRDLARSRSLGPRLALAGAAVGALVGWRLGAVPVLGVWVYVGAVAVVLGYLDARTRLLPTRIIAPSYVVVVALLGVAAALDGAPGPLLRAGLGWLVMGGFYFLLWLVYPAGMGYGDVRLAGLLGLALGYLGWAETLAGMYAGFLLGAIGGGVLAVAGLVDRKRYPFGPFMLLGALVGLLWGSALGDWYTAW
jgi:leader peptidase (prepilin peptidase)/N-methyltransferase